MFLLGRIRNLIEKDTITEEPISPEGRLAICLYRLARGDYYFTIAEMAGIGERTVGYIVNEVTTAIVECLWEDTVKKHMPKSEDEFRRKILDMEEAWQFPCCRSAVDGCHIRSKCLPGGLESCKEFHNFKHFFSVVLMGMVDSKNRFVWASCGYPGNSHDSVIFQSTDLWNQIKNQDYLPKIGKKVGSLLVPPLILGDAAFVVIDLTAFEYGINGTTFVDCSKLLIFYDDDRIRTITVTTRYDSSLDYYYMKSLE